MERQQLWSETQRTLLAMGENITLCGLFVSSPKREKQGQIRAGVRVCVEELRNCYTLLSLSGVCECSDFTAGLTCEHCLDGYYGNALIGTPGDCQPCPCPDRTSCAQIAETGQVVCTNCPTGQTGEMDHQQQRTILWHRTVNNWLHVKNKMIRRLPRGSLILKRLSVALKQLICRDCRSTIPGIQTIVIVTDAEVTWG